MISIEISGKALDKLFYPAEVFRAFSKVAIISTKDFAPEEIEMDEIPYYQRKESKSSFGVPTKEIEIREVLSFLRDWTKDKKTELDPEVGDLVLPTTTIKPFITKAYKFKVVCEEVKGCYLTVGRTLGGIPVKRPARRWEILVCDNSRTQKNTNSWSSWEEPLPYQRFWYLRAGLEGDRVKHLIIRDKTFNPLPNWYRKQLENHIQNFKFRVCGYEFQLWIVVENMRIVLTNNSNFLSWISQ